MEVCHHPCLTQCCNDREANRIHIGFGDLFKYSHWQWQQCAFNVLVSGRRMPGMADVEALLGLE